jgi:hypothetical protein
MSMVRAQAGSGAFYDDPSEDLLLMLMQDIERGDEQFVIVKRTSDVSGQTYAQVITDGSGGWTVERRDGGPDSHYSVDVASLRQAHTILTCWAFEIPHVPTPDWARVEF